MKRKSEKKLEKAKETIETKTKMLTKMLQLRHKKELEHDKSLRNLVKTKADICNYLKNAKKKYLPGEMSKKMGKGSF